MPFDFKTQFNNHSNEELLRIIKRHDNYQAEAISAAKEILSERNVTQEEINLVEKEVYYEEVNKKVVSETKSAIKETITKKIEYLINPVKHPNKEISPIYWITLLVIVQAIYYFIELPSNIKSISILIKDNEDILFNLSIAAYNITNLLFIPYLWYLLLKKRRWGWIFLLFTSIFEIVTYGFYFSEMMGYNSSLLSYGNFFLYLFLNVTILLFLLKEKALTFFNITESLKRKTIIYSILITISFLAILHIQ